MWKNIVNPFFYVMKRGGGRGGKEVFSLKELFIYIVLRHYTKFQPPTMSGSGQINFQGWVVGWVAGLLGNKTNSVSPAEVELKLS